MSPQPQYRDHTFKYTDPAQYDRRVKRPIEKYVKSLWLPILRQAIKRHINPKTVVCDLGCGTLEHTQYMDTAAFIYAVDTNPDMIAYGRTKVGTLSHKMDIRAEDATATSIPAAVCDVVWTVGLTEYVNVENLFNEISRVSHRGSILLLQFPNRWHPVHIAIAIAAPLLGRPVKAYRTLRAIKRAGRRHGWELQRTASVGIFLPGPAWLTDALIPIWPLFDWLWSPLQPYLPLGVNVWCEWIKKS